MYKEELLYDLRNKRSHQLQIIQDLEKNIQHLSDDEMEIKKLLLKVKRKELESLDHINRKINSLTENLIPSD